MIKIGFLMNYPTSYKGGINYFRNLFFAIDKFLKKDLECILFIPADLSQEYIDVFKPYIKIVKTNILTRNSLLWFIDKISEKLFNVNPLLNKLLVKHHIEIVSHSSFISRRVKTINWIMDFQHLHFSELWNDKEMKATKKFLHRLITKSDRIFLSSQSAFEDYKLPYNDLSDKVNILHFVSQPIRQLDHTLSKAEEHAFKIKYNIDRPFYYLPNQFWSHKNHRVVFEAINLLKKKGLNPLLVTSGLMKDFRSRSNHIQFLMDYVIEHDLEKNILFLGLIPYKDVLDLLTLSQCVINPSLFEGWSSTVEEAKSIGKKLVLSNITVHKEQNPKNGIYFDPKNPKELAIILEDIIKEDAQILHNVEYLQKYLNNRTENFAKNYLAGIKKLIN